MNLIEFRVRVSALALAQAMSKAAGHGIYLGQGRNGPLFAPTQHGVLVLGPPRTGKSTSIAIPNVLAASGSVLAVSTKPDVMDATSRSRSLVGRCHLFDPSGSTTRDGVEAVGWSPLRSAGSWQHAVLVAEAMVGTTRVGGEGSHWTERAGALLAALFHAAALESLTMRDVLAAVNRHEAAPFISVLGRNESLLALDLLVGIVETDARELSGIWSTASSVLAAYRTDAALASAELPALDATGFVASSDTLYVCAPGDAQAHVAPLIAGMLRDIRSAAYASAVSPSEQRHRTPVLLVLDELANIAPIHDLPALIAEGGSQGVVTLACLQDLSQARARWGVAADGFLSLFGSKVILQGIGDPRTLEAVSLLAGEQEVPTISVTRGKRHGLRRERTWTTGSRALRRLPPDAIALRREGRAVLLVGAKPGELELTPAWRTMPWSSLADL